MADRNLTGLALRSRSLEWATWSKAPDKSDAIAVARTDLDPGANQKDLVAGLRGDRDRLVEEIRAKVSRLPGAVAMGIPAARVLLRIVELPTTDPEEIRGMVELQVDKFSPFPAAESVISREILTEKDGRCRVLLSAVPTDTMNAVGDALRSAGIEVKWVDVNLLAWWRLLKDAGAIHGAGSQVVVILDQEACDLVVSTDGIPVAMRALSGMEDLPPADVADEVAREVVYTLASLDLDRAGAPVAEVAVWHRGDPPVEIVTRLSETFAVAVRPQGLETLPSLAEGLLRRRGTRAGHLLDLAPPAWQQAEQRQKARRRMVALSATLLGIWVAGIAVLFGGLQFQKQRLAAQEARLATLSAPAEKVRAVRERAQALEQYIDRSHSALECLREVSDLLPPGIELKSFAYHKGKSVELSGEADTVTLVYDFKKEMEKSRLFVSTALPRTTRTAQNKEVFKLTAVLPGGEKPGGERP